MNNKVLIFGGRDFANYKALCNRVSPLVNKDVDVLICGEAPGADLHARAFFTEFCDARIISEPADWQNIGVKPCVIKINHNGEKYNALAGSIRNRKMAEHYPRIAVGFWDGKSKGTLDMIRLCYEHNIDVIVYHYTFKKRKCVVSKTPLDTNHLAKRKKQLPFKNLFNTLRGQHGNQR